MDGLEKIKASEFKIWKSQLKTYNKENLERVLSKFCKISGPRFYIMDYFQGRIIVDSLSSTSSVLGGYPKEIIEKKGFDFFEIILDPKERLLLGEVNDSAYAIFSETPLEFREDLELSYDLTVKRADGQKVILNHRVMPYQLDDNGNLWLTLCCVGLSNQKKSGNPTLTNKKTKEYYEYIDGKFVKKELIVFSNEEKLILDYTIKGYLGEYIAMELGVSVSSLRRKKFLLYQRVGVNTTAELIHWAHLNGAI